MKTGLLILHVLLGIYTGALAKSEDTLITRIEKDNHDQVFRSKKYLAVKFCNLDLKSCKEIQRLYQKTAEDVQRENIPITLAEVDCKEQPEICRHHFASDQPMAKFYNRGKEELTLHRLTSGNWKLLSEIKNFVTSKTTVLKSFDEFKNFTDYEKPCIIGFFRGNCELKNVFRRVADELRADFPFAVSESTDLNNKAGYPNAIVIYYPKRLRNKFEEDQLKYNGKSTDQELKEFIIHNAFGLAGLRDLSNQHFFTKRPLFVVYFDVDFINNAQDTRYWRNRVLKVAKDYRGTASFAISNEASFDQELENFGLKKNGERLISGDGGPMVAALSSTGRHRMTQEFSADNLAAFVEGVLKGDIEPYLKSEPEVDTENDFVKVVVAKNFDRLVVRSEKNVFLMLFTPACGTCRGLSVKLDELDQQFANKDVVFAKMDTAANDAPLMFQNIFEDKPNLFWLSKNDKHRPIRYTGVYEIEKIVKFIMEKLAAGSEETSESEKIQDARSADEL